MTYKVQKSTDGTAILIPKTSLDDDEIHLELLEAFGTSDCPVELTELASEAFENGEEVTTNDVLDRIYDLYR